jgi:orotidine-5'-phosphate decarboxylase
MAEDQATSDAARSRLAIALDVDDVVEALRIAREVKPWFGVAKVGLELYSAVGPDAIGGLVDLGYDVFADVKLHDIPTTVGRAAAVFGALGVRWLNFHAAGGEAMLRAGIEGLRAGAERAGLPVPTALAVTVLTSDPEATPALLRERTATAVAAGCGGVVCAAADIAVVRFVEPRLVCVTPGIRPAGADPDDQVRTATPAAAVGAGADLLVLGRAVTTAPDRAATAAAVHAEVITVLERADD